MAREAKDFNGFTYCRVHKSQFSEVESHGYSPIDTISDDGNWAFICKADVNMNTWCKPFFDLVPQWMKDKGATEDCCMDHKLAWSLISTPCTVGDGSTGFYVLENE